jgi:NADH dehydrogenase FAD-containing subunit
MNATDPTTDRGLVLGGGLAGVACAQKLGDEGIDVVLADRNDYHQLKPLLYRTVGNAEVDMFRSRRVARRTARRTARRLDRRRG